MKTLGRIFDKILDYSAYLVAAILVYMTLSVVFEVVSRYIFSSPTRWVVDFTEYSMIYITFLAAAWVLYKERHVKVDIVLINLPRKIQRALNAITSLAAAAACGIVFWYSFSLTFQAFAKNELIWGSMIVPKGLVWIALPIGMFLLILQFIRRAWTNIRGREQAAGE